MYHWNARKNWRTLIKGKTTESNQQLDAKRNNCLKKKILRYRLVWWKKYIGQSSSLSINTRYIVIVDRSMMKETSSAKCHGFYEKINRYVALIGPTQAILTYASVSVCECVCVLLSPSREPKNKFANAIFFTSNIHVTETYENQKWNTIECL